MSSLRFPLAFWTIGLALVALFVAARLGQLGDWLQWATGAAALIVAAGVLLRGAWKNVHAGWTAGGRNGSPPPAPR